MATEKVSEKLCKQCNSQFCDYPCEPSECYLLDAVENAVEVVRCKDCIHYRVFGIRPSERRCAVFDGANEFPYPTEPDDFCSYGERKDNG